MPAPEAEHTPTPWKITREHPDIDTANAVVQIKPESHQECQSPHGFSGDQITIIYAAKEGSRDLANARLIVESVNAHARLVAENERLRRALADAGNRLSSAASAFDKAGNEWMAEIYCNHANEARAALEPEGRG